MPRTSRRFVLICLVWLAVFPAPSAAAAGPDDAKVYVILWFDTEDYLLPADDDATLHLCKFLSDEGARATFKLVGEKARVLEKRGRADVIDALKKHEIGYHSNFHSVQPTPALFMSRQGWDDGVAEFDRRERQGMLDVERITGQQPSCYGQPGSSWGPQQFGAMRQWGMPVFLDAGSHVRLEGGPFWYCGILNLYALKATLRTNLGGPKDLTEAKKRFDKAYEELLAEGGGPVSIYYHPCEFVHKQFWDGVNFSKGANPPRSEWKIPPQKTPEESRVAYETFEGYIRFVQSHPKVKFVTAREALELYRDGARGRQFSTDDIVEIADQIATPMTGSAENVSFQRHGPFTLSAAETMLILTQYAATAQTGRRNATVTLDRSPFGPTIAAPIHDAVTTNRSQLERTVADVADYLERHNRVPNAVWIGSTPISPESYLKTLGRYVTALAAQKATAETVEFAPAPRDLLHPATYVATDDPKLWGWVIFPPDFRAPEMMQLAKRQAWTLKPAVLSNHSRAAN